MKIAIVTDAWRPQINGVVRTLETTAHHLHKAGHEVLLLTPADQLTFPCPSYPSIRLAIFPSRKLKQQLQNFAPDAIHIATEGPLGHAAQAYCRRRRLPFTTSFHTQFPEYIRARAPLPVSWSYAYLRRFHARATRTLVATESLRQSLTARGFINLRIWARGVDTQVFYPRGKQKITAPRPISLYLGRVAIEKNIETFLQLDLPGTKYVVGDGPDLARLKKIYPNTVFTGAKFGDELAEYLSAADVFVFPSLTDTFGLVLLEAMACGVPVAAFPVTGPIDIVQPGVTGIVANDLREAVSTALRLDPKACVAFARERTWQACTQTFIDLLAPINACAERGANRSPLRAHP